MFRRVPLVLFTRMVFCSRAALVLFRREAWLLLEELNL